MVKKKSNKKNTSSPKKEVKATKKTNKKKIEIKTCPKCNTEVTRKYCPNCGENVEELVFGKIEEKIVEEKKEGKTCPNCNIEVTRKYCPNCGENVEALVFDKLEEKVEEEQKENKHCPKCNTEVTRKYCPNCGEHVEEVISGEKVEEILVDQNNNNLLEQETILPPVNSVGIPGVIPIPDVGMNHNAVKQYNFSEIKEEVLPKKENDNKLMYIIIALIVVIAVVAIIVVLLVDRASNTNSFKEEPSSSTNLTSNSSSNISSNTNTNSNVEEESNTKTLTCTLKEKYEDGITSISRSTYTFQEEKIIKAYDEEILEFSETGMQYYETYEKQVKDELADDSYIFDNTVLEMIKTENSIGLSYTIDLLADPKNPNNDLDLLGTTYKEAKKELESEGYKCE